MNVRITWPLLALGLLTASSSGRARPPPTSHWCAPELGALSESMCAFSPKRDTDTLVIFLHGVVKPDTGWQHNQQRFMVRAARVNGFVTLTPRGRRGIGPRKMRHWWTWPTSAQAQTQVEAELLDEWRAARTELETARGNKFKNVWLVGFSNGAYYSASLALRGRLPEVSGYGVFAGGGGAHLLVSGRQTKHRPPIYVGYGTRDKAATKDSRHLARTLRSLGWKHRLVPRRKVGHTMTDAQLNETVGFLRLQSKPKSER